MKRLSQFVIAILLMCAMASPLLGKAKKKATPAPVHPTTISAVTGNTVTIVDDKTAKALTVSQFTEITVNGQKATVADLKPGMVVSVVLGSTPTQASRITATSR